MPAPDFLSYRESLNDEIARFIQQPKDNTVTQSSFITKPAECFEGTHVVIGSPETAARMRVTSQMARAWLHRNIDNRKLRLPRVAEWKMAMECGLWRCTHQGIAFDSNGVVSDGQHRLIALSEMSDGFAIETWVFFNQSPEVKKYVDHVTPRTIADRNKDLSVAAIEIGRFIISSKVKRRPSLEEIEQYYTEHKAALDWIAGVWSTDRGICRTPIKAAFVVLHEYNPEIAELSYAGLRTGAGLNEHDPILRLRNLAITGKQGVKVNNNDLWNGAQSAIKAVIDGRSLKRLFTVRK